MAEQHEGIVKSKGQNYGWIATFRAIESNKHRDLFFQVKDAPEGLRKGMRVRFEIGPDYRGDGIAAIEIEIIQNEQPLSNNGNGDLANEMLEKLQKMELKPWTGQDGDTAEGVVKFFCYQGYGFIYFLLQNDGDLELIEAYFKEEWVDGNNRWVYPSSEDLVEAKLCTNPKSRSRNNTLAHSILPIDNEK